MCDFYIHVSIYLSINRGVNFIWTPLLSFMQESPFYMKRNHHIFGRPVLFSRKHIQMLYFWNTILFYVVGYRWYILSACIDFISYQNIINSELYITVDTFQFQSLCSFSSSFVLQCESARWKKVWLFWDLRPYLAQSSSKTEVSLNRRTNVF